MTTPIHWGWATILMFSVGSLSAQPASAPVDALNTQGLSEQFRLLLLKNLPDPLVVSERGWGVQKEVTIGLKWERKGAIRFRPELMRDRKNDGHWQKVTIAAIEPEQSLTLKISDVRQAEGKTLFDAILNLDVNANYEQQIWAMGKRMYAGETRARCHAELKLSVELTSQLTTKPKSLIPDMSFRVRVTNADLTYRDLVCEHTLGVGGDAARLLGKVVYDVLKTVKPDFEKSLLEKANTAIVKAADTKEVKVEFDKLLSGQLPKVSKNK
jgi:hypothetical protein